MRILIIREKNEGIKILCAVVVYFSVGVATAEEIVLSYEEKVEISKSAKSEAERLCKSTKEKYSHNDYIECYDRAFDATNENLTGNLKLFKKIRKNEESVLIEPAAKLAVCGRDGIAKRLIDEYIKYNPDIYLLDQSIRSGRYIKLVNEHIELLQLTDWPGRGRKHDECRAVKDYALEALTVWKRN